MYRWGAAGAPEPAEKYSWAMRFGMDTRTHTHTAMRFGITYKRAEITDRVRGPAFCRANLRKNDKRIVRKRAYVVG